MRCRAFRQYVIYVHGGSAPSDAEWECVLELYRSVEHLGPRVLVLTMGAAPTAAQRARLHQIQQGRAPQMALLTASRLARAAGVAYSWFNPKIRLLAVDAIEEAASHLGATPEEGVALRRIVGELLAEMGLGVAVLEQAGGTTPP
jgi:hypothetical protein